MATISCYSTFDVVDKSNAGFISVVYVTINTNIAIGGGGGDRETLF